MHSVQRSQEPYLLADLRTRHSSWEQLEPQERRAVRAALADDFNRVCGYCERDCRNPTLVQRGNEESVDHFRPRSRFPEQWLKWLNFVYACRRCNQAKGDSWPGYDDHLVDQWLIAEDARYTPVSEYVNPNEVHGQRSVGRFFGFDVETGEIGPSEQLDRREWSMARRTIRDIDLNSTAPGQDNLPELRKLARALLDETLQRVSDPGSRLAIVAGFVDKSRPFSTFMSKCARSMGYAI